MIHASPRFLRQKDSPRLPFLLNPNPNPNSNPNPNPNPCLLLRQSRKRAEASPSRFPPHRKDRPFIVHSSSSSSSAAAASTSSSSSSPSPSLSSSSSSSSSFAPDQQARLALARTPSRQELPPSVPSASDSFPPPIVQEVCRISGTLSARDSETGTFGGESPSSPLSASSLSSDRLSPPPDSGAMKDSSARSKVVVRHLPPALSQQAFMEHIEAHFSGSLNWITFFPGKSSIKDSIYSRAYIGFKQPDDVFEFHEKFNGHIFVNEKGTQYKAMVEYAPNQRIPKLWHKKDAREGTISQDPEYLKFVEMLSKPIEYLPSAEVQLERKEAERNSSLASGAKDSIIVTPLMEFVRQKRALKSMPQKLLAGSGKTSAAGSSPSAKTLPKRVSRTSLYSSGSRLKEKSMYVTRSDDRKARVVIEIKEKKVNQDISRKAVSNSQNKKSDSPAIENGAEQSNSHPHMVGKKDNASANQVDGVLVNRIMRSLMNPVQSQSNSQSVISNDSNLPPKPAHSGDNGGRTNKGASSSKAPVLLQKSDQHTDKDKHSSKSQVWRSSVKESNNNSENESQQHHGSANYTEERAHTSGRRLRNKDRPDRPVWTVRRRADVSSNAESPTSLNVVPSLSPPGSQRQGKGPKEGENNTVAEAGRPMNRRVGGIASIYGGHEKQVWVAKPVSGS